MTIVTVAELANEIAGSDSGPSAVLAGLSPTVTLTSELIVVLGTSKGGYQPLQVQHLTATDDGKSWSVYYLTIGYFEGYRAELFNSLETVSKAIAFSWTPLTADELATLQLTSQEAHSNVRRATYIILEARRDAKSMIPPGAPLQAIESHYLDAALGVCLTRSVWPQVNDTVKADV